MARMTMTKAMKHYAPTFEEIFERFLANRKAKGSSDKTLQTYHYHFRAISKYLGQYRAIASAVFDGSFVPIMPFEKLDIHPVFLRFSNVVLCPNIPPNSLAGLCGDALDYH